MSPSAISTTPSRDVQQTSALTAEAVAKKLAQTAPTSPKVNGTRNLAVLDSSRLKFTPTTTPRAVLAEDDPRRNSTFCTDHMITAVWHESTGWEAPELRAYGPLAIMPNASVLHYATECFEGLKAYRGFDGKLRLFRPDCNARRMLTSATRIALPGFDPVELEKLIHALMAIDGLKFLPKAGTFIYLRPTLIGTHAGLGVQMPSEATLFIIATYMADMSKPEFGMKLLASQDDTVRAWPGGFGFAKVGANYGPSLMAQQEARARGYDQILWLFGEDRMVTEAGASNFMLVWRTREGQLQLITAPLTDKIILDGVTRRSLLQLARERFSNNKCGLETLEVVERRYTMHEVAQASREGRIIEAFACGTAYFVVPVSTIHYKNEDLQMPMVRGDCGEYAWALKNWLVGIMYGKEQHEWGVTVEEKQLA